MRLNITQEDGFTLSIIVGVLDAAHAPAAKEKLLKVEGSLIVDLSMCPFIDSTGLSTFISLYKKFRGTQFMLILCGLTYEMYQTFAMTKLSTIFTIMESATDAAKLIRSTR